MRYCALAVDYDGTLALNGAVDARTSDALEQLAATGRRILLVTGRELPSLLAAFPRVELFEWVVAENGAVLYQPSTKEVTVLADPPPAEFVDELHRIGVAPLSVGHVVVGTYEPLQHAVLDAIRRFGLEMQVIFNKGAVMALPTGVNKASGLLAALAKAGLSPHNVVGIGDAENDHAFLKLCEASAAVANALPAVKDTADFVTSADHGAGVVELIAELTATDLAKRAPRLHRHNLRLGTHGDQEIRLPAFGPSVLICGPSGSGKSTVTTRLIESIVEQAYQFCLVDPEGDYEAFEGAIVMGSAEAAASTDEIMQVLKKPDASAVVNLIGLPVAARPPFCLDLLGPLLRMRSRCGRPHWLVFDEAHHLLPIDWEHPAEMMPEQLNNLVLVTVHPNMLSPSILKRIDTLLVVGPNPAATVAEFCNAVGLAPPPVDPEDLAAGDALIWFVPGDEPPLRIRVEPCQTERKRHRRKYAEGELPPDRSFFFRGAEGKLNLRAQNVSLFLQLAEGVDDETWNFHLAEGDYSRWFREVLKNPAVADELAEIEETEFDSPAESRRAIRAAIERDYVVGPSPPLPVPGAG